MARLPYRDLEQALKALANANRLQLLVQLQQPKSYREIELTPSREDGQGSADRAISRPAVRGHLQRLQEVGVVHEQDSDGAKRFIVDHARLFALLQEAMQLATVTPSVQPDGKTMDLEVEARDQRIDGPHLVLVRGVREGEVFDLTGAATEWTIGRRESADIALDYDAYVSSRHAKVLEQDGMHLLVDLPENRNGTLVNWRRLRPGTPVRLHPGDVVGLGMSLMVYREGRQGRDRR